MRTTAREIVFKYIYSRLFNPSDEGLFDVLAKDLNVDDRNFANAIKDQIIQNESKYFDVMGDLAIGYKLNRIYSTDKCALLVGMAEFDIFKETPRIVIIDETVKLASKYSTDNSPDFVNGIMATYTEEK